MRTAHAPDGFVPSGPSSRANEEALTPAVVLWMGLGTAVQIGLVVAGHYGDAVYAMWPMPLLLTSVFAAVAYANQVRRSPGDSAWHGGMVGGACAFLGTALAAVLADVPARDLATVPLAAIALGALAGWLTFVGMKAVSPARVE